MVLKLPSMNAIFFTIILLLSTLTYSLHVHCSNFCEESKWDDVWNEIEFKKPSSISTQSMNNLIGKYYKAYYSSDLLKISNSKVIVITFVDEKILSYAKYSSIVNILYSTLSNYSIIFTTIQDSKHLLPDGRWEKVRLLNDVFTYFETVLEIPVVGQSTKPFYFLWIDADIILQNIQNPLDRLLTQYPSYEMIIGAEWHSATGVANTGCFFLQYNTWSKQMLAAWWKMDHTQGHDQILFDVYYKQQLNVYAEQDPHHVHKHILIVPTRLMNTVPPTYATYQPTDNVLHLMGERHEYREAVFRSAWERICAYWQRNCFTENEAQDPATCLRSTLEKAAITPDLLILTLQEVTNTQIMLKEKVILEALAHRVLINEDDSAMSAEGIWSWEELFDALGEYRELRLQQTKVHLVQTMSQIIQKDKEELVDEEAQATRQQQQQQDAITSLSRTYHALSEVLHVYRDPSTEESNSPLFIRSREQTRVWSTNERIQALQYMTMLGNDLLLTIQSYHFPQQSIHTPRDDWLSWHDQEYRPLVQEIEWGLSTLVTLVLQKSYVYAMIAMFYSNQLQYCLRVSVVTSSSQTESGQSYHWRKEAISYANKAYSIYTQSISTEERNRYEQVEVLLYAGKAYCTLPAVPVSSAANSSIVTTQAEILLEELTIGINRYKEGIVLLQSLLSAERQLKEDHYRLVEMILSAGKCILLRDNYYQGGIMRREGTGSRLDGKGYDEDVHEWILQLDRLMKQFDGTEIGFQEYVLHQREDLVQQVTALQHNVQDEHRTLSEESKEGSNKDTITVSTKRLKRKKKHLHRLHV